MANSRDIGIELKKHLAFGLALLALLAGLASAQSEPAVRRYKVMELPLQPLHLNNSGVVVGTTGENSAATWSQTAGLRRLPTLKEFPESEARSSNSSAHVVGFLRKPGQTRAFVYKNGTLVVLTGDRAKALAMNDSDQIVGESGVGEKTPISAVLWQNGHVTDLGGCCGGSAKGINNRGQIIGDVYDRDGRYRATLWDGKHGIQDLMPNQSYTSAIAINDSGHVLVQVLEQGLYLYREPGKMVRVSVPNQQPADGRALSNKGEVVGAYGPFSDENRAFVWSEKGGFHDLNDLIPAGSGWKLQLATGINDRGEIVGLGDHNGKDGVGFLLVEEDAGTARRAGSRR